MTTQYIIYTIIAFVVSLACGLMLIPGIQKFCIQNNLYDLPNARKVHKSSIPRLGGTCFIPSTLVAAAISICIYRVSNGQRVEISLWSCMFVVSLALIYTVGLIDDIVGVKPKTKFLAQIAAASLLPAAGLYINDLYGFCGIHHIPFCIGAPLTVLVIVFIDNALNLIDGIDGLAGSIGVIALLGFLYSFMRENIFAYSAMIAGFIGVLVAFLYFNIFGKAGKSKIFMGDSGSLSLGFILGFLVIKFSKNDTAIMPYRSDSLLIAYTLLIVPCFDVVRVIITRLRQHRPLFKADKCHIHHKLLRCGMTQHQALVCILSLQIGFSVLNAVLHSHISLTGIVVTDIALYTVLHLWLTHIIGKREKDTAVTIAKDANGE